MISQHWGTLVEVPKCVVYPEEYGELFLETIVAHNKRRMGDKKICGYLIWRRFKYDWIELTTVFKFCFAIFTRNRQVAERDSNS